MASLVPLFDAASVRLIAQPRVTLADPPRPDAATGAESKAVIRLHASRAAACPVEFLQLRPRAGAITVVSPVRGVTRRVTLHASTPLPGGVVELLEITPLPFDASAASTLRR